MNDIRPPSEDEGLTHTVVNYLNAAYQGKFAYLNILAQLGQSGLVEDDIESTKNLVAETRRWFDWLLERKPILRATWTKAELPDAQRALTLTAHLTRDFKQFADKILSTFSTPDLEQQSALIAFLVAAYGRHAYMRDNYIRGNQEYGEKLNLPELVNASTHHLRETAEEVNLTHSMIKELKRGAKPASGFFTILATETRTLPGCFRVFAHEANVILHSFNPEFTFEMAEIRADDAGRWKMFGLPPTEAGNWVAHEISPEEAAAWIGLNLPAIYSSGAAARWRLCGFTPDGAKPWAELGIPPTLAQVWRDADFAAHAALDFLKKGVRFPPKKAPESPN